MSLATRCPHCETVFRVSGEHLAAAQGWVRCGACSSVFDAAEHLVTPEGRALEVPTISDRGDEPAPQWQPMPEIDLELPDVSAVQALTAPSPSPSPSLQAPSREPFWSDTPAVQAATTHPHAPDAQPGSSSQPGVGGAAPTGSGSGSGSAVPSSGSDFSLEPPNEPHAQAASEREHSDLRGDLRIDLRGDSRRDLRSGAGNQTELLSAASVAAASVAAATAPAPANDHPAPATPHAAPHAPPPTAPNRSGAGWVWVGLLLVSLIALLAHGLRGHVAQAWPQTRGFWISTCAALGCEMPALRQLDLLRVNGSSLSHDSDRGVHRLRVTLGNPSELPLVAPALDLTLLDSEGRVLARRAIDPLEVDPPLRVLEAGAQHTVTLTMNLQALGETPVSSFKVDPFYP